MTFGVIRRGVGIIASYCGGNRRGLQFVPVREYEAPASSSSGVRGSCVFQFGSTRLLRVPVRECEAPAEFLAGSARLLPGSIPEVRGSCVFQSGSTRLLPSLIRGFQTRRRLDRVSPSQDALPGDNHSPPPKQHPAWQNQVFYQLMN